LPAFIYALYLLIRGLFLFIDIYSPREGCGGSRRLCVSTERTANPRTSPTRSATRGTPKRLKLGNTGLVALHLIG